MNMSSKRREALLNSGQALSKSFSLPKRKSFDQLDNLDDSPKKRGRKKGSKNRKKGDEHGFPTLGQDFTEESFLDRQKRLKAIAPTNENEESFFGGATDRRKKNEIYNQLNEYEKDRFTRLDKAKIPEKHVKKIVTRVLGTDVHINKTMLKIIGGIAKVYVGELIEEAKLAQVKEEYEVRETLGLNDRFKYINKTHENEDDIDVDVDSKTPNKELEEDKDDNDSDSKKSDKDENESENDSPNKENSTPEKSDSLPEKEESKETKSELIRDPNRPAEEEDDILKSTLHNEVPLMPRHLRIARDEYEKKRLDSKL
jgi:hypothetical protein